MKKGFTLVELLAVIAILAILVLIALPNIMGMFNGAKKSLFLVEVKEIYKVALQTWMQDPEHKNGSVEYARCSTCSLNQLDLSGRSEIEYYIKILKGGRVTVYYVTDGTYQYHYNNSSGLIIENIIEVEQISDLDEDDVIKIENNAVSSGVSAEGDFNSYPFLLENTSFVKNSYSPYWWTETYAWAYNSSSNPYSGVFAISGNTRAFSDGAPNVKTYGVRPVIEVPKSDVKY